MLHGLDAAARLAEHEVSCEEFNVDAFGALLHFIYTGHVVVERPAVLLPMARRYGLERVISLCELAISKELDRACEDKIAGSSADPFALLQLANSNAAQQLTAFLRHFIASNYEPLKLLSAFEEMDQSDREYVEQHRWPPIWYLDEVAAYEQECKRESMSEKGCTLM
jgi:hypothetical protein